MALTWDWSEVAKSDLTHTIADHTSITDGYKEGDQIRTPEAQAMIWYMLFTDVGWQLTEDNIEEFIARIKVYDKLLGPYLIRGDVGPHEIPEEYIRACIGLRTNVSYKPRAQWLLHIFEQAFPKCDKEDAGTKLWYVEVDLDGAGDTLGEEVWATDAQQAREKAMTIWRRRYGQHTHFPPYTTTSEAWTVEEAA